jgi:hypothetical protein
VDFDCTARHEMHIRFSIELLFGRKQHVQNLEFFNRIAPKAAAEDAKSELHYKNKESDSRF